MPFDSTRPVTRDKIGLTELADFLETLEPTAFDMETWGAVGKELEMRCSTLGRPRPECGTAACIAGWACLLAGYDFTRREKYLREALTVNRARQLLGLTADEAHQLFLGVFIMPCLPSEWLPKITVEQATRELRRLAKEKGET